MGNAVVESREWRVERRDARVESREARVESSAATRIPAALLVATFWELVDLATALLREEAEKYDGRARTIEVFAGPSGLADAKHFQASRLRAAAIALDGTARQVRFES